MVLKIYGIPQSTATRRVLVVCKELNIPYEFVPVDLQKGEHKAEDFLQKQPFGQVPVLDDDGFILYESRAISRYLAAKAGSPLLPKQSDLQTWAKFEVASSTEAANFEVPSYRLFYEKVLKSMFFGGTTDEKLVKELTEGLEAKLAVYETILSKQKYLAGNDITLADLFHLPNGHYLGMSIPDLFKAADRPNVARWWSDISSRPSWQSVKDMEGLSL